MPSYVKHHSSVKVPWILRSASSIESSNISDPETAPVGRTMSVPSPVASVVRVIEVTSTDPIIMAPVPPLSRVRSVFPPVEMVKAPESTILFVVNV